jgi:carnitine 3-dehydrogenase
MYPDPQKITRVTSLGGGPIGGGWAAHFLARGYDVTLYLHDVAETAAFEAVLDTAWKSLTDLGLAPGASRDRLRVVTDLQQAVEGAQFIQESAPENLSLKRKLYAELGRLVPPDVVIGSSTSGLTMTDIQADCATPERCVIGHPFNPPYLLPLVEIVGGRSTDPAAVAWAGAFYESAGKAPLIMKKEIPGFVATRLQEACGAGGMATNLDQFGPALKLPWTRLDAPELTQQLRDRMVDGCNEMAAGRRFEDMAAKRDQQIVAVLRAIRDTS